MNYALSAYPLTQVYKEKLETLNGSPIQFLLLGDLRQMKLLALIQFLRSLKPNKFFLPLEDQASIVLLPILQIIAKFSTPVQMLAVHSNFNTKVINLRNIVYSCLQLIKATLAVQLSYRLSLHKMRRLLNQASDPAETPLIGSKKLLYLNANLWFGVKAGGSVGHIAGVVNALVEQGINVDYAAFDRSLLLSSAVNFIQLPMVSTFGIPAELNYYYFNNKIMNFLGRKNKSEWNFIYQRMSVANYSGVTLSRQLNIPLVLEYNGSEAWVAKNWGRALRYHDAAVKSEDICLKHAHRIVTISEVLRQELLTRGVPPEKIVFYPNCIDPALFNPARFTTVDNLSVRAKHHIPAESIVLTFVGTFGQWHGVDILAKAIQLMIVTQEQWLKLNNVHFLLVGDGLKMQLVKDILAQSINNDYVTLTGLVPQTEAPAYLAASDILLSPHVSNSDGSRFFGSPTKLFEYMAMGKAIIASDIEQIGEVLNNSLRIRGLPTSLPSPLNTELALLCAPGSVEQLIEAIQFLVINAQWRDVLGMNARQEALEKYTWERHVSAFINKKCIEV